MSPKDADCKLVLLPGLDGTGRLFVPLLRAMGEDVKTVVVSYASDSVRDYDELSMEVVKSLPKGPYVLVAESFSGPIALRVASRQPKGLQAVVLCATFVTPPRAWLVLLLGSLVGNWCFKIRLPDWCLRAFAVGHRAGKELCEAVRSASNAVEPEVLVARLRRVFSVDARTSLATCPVPVHYLNATEDRLLGRGSLHVIRQVLPSVHVVNVPGPHFLFQAAPHYCARVLKDILGMLCARLRAG